MPAQPPTAGSWQMLGRNQTFLFLRCSTSSQHPFPSSPVLLQMPSAPSCPAHSLSWGAIAYWGNAQYGAAVSCPPSLSCGEGTEKARMELGVTLRARHRWLRCCG